MKTKNFNPRHAISRHLELLAELAMAGLEANREYTAQKTKNHRERRP
jgi:hypothetical protein